MRHNTTPGIPRVHTVNSDSNAVSAAYEYENRVDAAKEIAFGGHLLEMGAIPEDLERLYRERFIGLKRSLAPGFSYGMTYVGHTECPTFIVFAGLILTDARQVAITLSTGKTITTTTIPSPHGLAQSLRFWATHIPCGASPTAMIGRDSAGRIVARINSRLLPHIR